MIAGDSLSYTNATVVHPIGLGILVVCILYLLSTSRNKVLLPILVMMVVVPSAQRISIFSVDFSFIRIVLLIAIARILIKNENRNIQRSNSDIIIALWMFWSIFSYGILIEQFSGVITRTGYMIDAVGSYAVGRIYIRNSDDLRRVIVFLGYVAIPMAILFLFERATGKNLFSVFGGVPYETLIRKGRLRCQGPFSHPIMAGVFWASILPWLGALWFINKISIIKFLIFTVFILIIIINTASSTPVMSVIFVALGFALFNMRHIMPAIRVALFFILIFLHLFMEKGVFHLISRIDIAGGSTGWHRYHLIDKSFAHIDEWWAIGTLSTGHWGYGLEDVTNQYLLEGVRGGLISMLLFILFIILIYKGISKRMRISKGIKDAWLLWAIGTFVFMHVMNFFAVSYFGQMTSALYLFFGAAISLIENNKRISRAEDFSK